MKKIFTLILFLFALQLYAQTQRRTDSTFTPKPTNRPPAGEISSSRTLPPDMVIESTGEILSSKGIKIPYRIKTGTQPVWNESGKIIASCFYTYYERSDIKDKASRPIVFSFNGGPGSASVWMHLAYTGPKILHIDDEGYPLQPYGYKDNPHTILDVADIIFIDPVNTGFSRIIDPETPRSVFFGVNADIKYLGEWLNTFVSRVNRWASPKFLIGESYGTTRVAGLALELQNNHWMYLNGVIMVSPTDLGIKRDEMMSAALRIPYFAATAWYHKKLKEPHKSKSLESYLAEVEEFTINEVVPALSKGGFINADSKAALAKKISGYTSISEATLMQNNLDIRTQLFWKELLRDEGYTVGRLDSRYKGIDSKDAGESPEFNSELSSWLHSFTPPINMYLREELKFKTDLKYNMFGPVHPWQRDDVNVAENLRAAMAANPYLKVMTQSGYFDGATDYFNAKYNHWHMDPSGKTKNRIVWKGYQSGHMMYLRKEDLQKANDDVRDFIKSALPAPNQPAKY